MDSTLYHFFERYLILISLLLGGSLALSPLLRGTEASPHIGQSAHSLSADSVAADSCCGLEITMMMPPPVENPFESAATKLAEKKADSTLKVLLTGDSMSETLYPLLVRWAKKAGYIVKLAPFYSATTQSLGRKDTLLKAVQFHQPDFIIFMLGSNELFIPKIRTMRAKYMDGVLRQLGDIPYIYVTPPNWKEDSGIHELIADHVPEPLIFTSKYLRLDRRRDGAHPTRVEGMVWADTIMRWIRDQSPYQLDLLPADAHRLSRYQRTMPARDCYRNVTMRPGPSCPLQPKPAPDTAARKAVAQPAQPDTAKADTLPLASPTPPADSAGHHNTKKP